jgi:hypothetical protein
MVTQSSDVDPAGYTYHGPTWRDVAGAGTIRASIAEERLRVHQQLASRWVRIANPLAWATAAVAALSGVTVIIDSGPPAVALSILTAILAATSVALDPADKARSQQAAAQSYHRLRRRIENFVAFDVSDWARSPSAEQLKEARAKLDEFDDAIQAAEEAAPAAFKGSGLPPLPSGWDPNRGR